MTGKEQGSSDQEVDIEEEQAFREDPDLLHNFFTKLPYGGNRRLVINCIREGVTRSFRDRDERGETLFDFIKNINKAVEDCGVSVSRIKELQEEILLLPHGEDRRWELVTQLNTLTVPVYLRLRRMGYDSHTLRS